MINAVVLGGSLNNGPLREYSPVDYEALIPVGPKVMVEYVVEALLGARRINRVVVVGPVKELSPLLSETRVTLTGAAGGIMENIGAGLNLLPGEKRVLLVTSDIPMLTPGSVDDFIELCGDMAGDVYYPIIPKEVVEKRFASTRRTYVALKEGVFTGGNIFLFNPAVFGRCIQNGKRIFGLRKSPLRLCRLIGFSFVLKYLLRILDIEDVCKRASELLGVKGEVVVSKYPEIGVDVDKPGDLELAGRFLGDCPPRRAV
ncbi:nucleotidyltransferase family protein [Pelotomaculum terephthalicicum JT]|uniref:nucleotidyltransferase family protein n=1 Tax=Pelotomaculum TaxID=191373 RepID=UPI0009C84993|nr:MULTISPECIES: nucleotidyltransferase family protein [Pelotomaculum]MCG9969021.1 nucleotidyltransferase family protein [Pelotomaculum terephthalicicum JT]OPX91375.1 MAG: 2-phospho-L-lactate guanylyltransferase [Pelotomaculum sp. PtaB.Bin117]OPY60590.1 MAG: 2-phospho-L-lactate guanylyltransferase [Pelotomaculum sp. PtaU1.Bin065]